MYHGLQLNAGANYFCAHGTFMWVLNQCCSLWNGILSWKWHMKSLDRHLKQIVLDYSIVIKLGLN